MRLGSLTSSQYIMYLVFLEVELISMRAFVPCLVKISLELSRQIQMIQQSKDTDCDVHSYNMS